VHVLKYVPGHVLRISVEIKGRTDKTVAGGMGFCILQGPSMENQPLF
jgi:hypothetical protein